MIYFTLYNRLSKTNCRSVVINQNFSYFISCTNNLFFKLENYPSVKYPRAIKSAFYKSTFLVEAKVFKGFLLRMHKQSEELNHCGFFPQLSTQHTFKSPFSSSSIIFFSEKQKKRRPNTTSRYPDIGSCHYVLD